MVGHLSLVASSIAPLVWYFCSRADMLAVEHIQKHMLRMVYEDYDSPYEDLQAKCHMSTQECQRSRTLTTEVYKAVNGMTSNYTQELFEVKEKPYLSCDVWLDPVFDPVFKISMFSNYLDHV